MEFGGRLPPSTSTFRPPPAGGPTFAVVARDTVFTDKYIFATNPHANYDVMPDGEHFVMLESAGEGVLTVVVNWRAVLRAQRASGAAR